MLLKLPISAKKEAPFDYAPSQAQGKAPELPPEVTRGVTLSNALLRPRNLSTTYLTSLCDSTTESYRVNTTKAVSGKVSPVQRAPAALGVSLPAS